MKLEPTIQSRIRVATLQGATLAEIAERFDLAPGEITRYAELVHRTTLDRIFRLRARSQRTMADERGRQSVEKKS